MSTQLITNYFRLHNVNQFKESVSETANSTYYVFAAKHVTYPDGDSNIPSLTNSLLDTLTNPYDEMIFGKRVTPSDVAVMVPRYNWTTNTYYNSYKSDQDLTSKQYYVTVSSGAAYHTFKCLDNNSNAASVNAPDITQTSADDSYYATADGYQWKYMYSTTLSTFNKFATTDYMPVVANNLVVANAVSGAIDVISVTYRGSSYNTFLSNTFISTDLRIGGDTTKYYIANNAVASNNFYTGSFIYLTNGTGAGQGRRITDYLSLGGSKTITLATPFNTAPDTTTSYQIGPGVNIEGDGDGAAARAIVNTSQSNTISSIEIIDRGSNYTRVSATVTGNTSGVSNLAIIEAVLGPKGGHGSNPEYELGASALCMSVTFANTESGTIPTQNDYRAVGVIKDPLYANVVITVGSASGPFSVGETVIQANTGAQGVVTEWDTINTLSLTDVNGIVLTGNTSVNYLTGQTSGTTSSVVSYQINGQAKNFNTFDQRYRYTFTPLAGTFTSDEAVYQTDVQLANAVFHSNTSANLFVTHLRGVLNTGNTLTGQSSGATANLLFAYPRDIVPNSGEVIYFENESPISRSNSQSETIKIILQF
jgi:hypothetical protein